MEHQQFDNIKKVSNLIRAYGILIGLSYFVYTKAYSVIFGSWNIAVCIGIIKALLGTGLYILANYLGKSNKAFKLIVFILVSLCLFSQYVFLKTSGKINFIILLFYATPIIVLIFVKKSKQLK